MKDFIISLVTFYCLLLAYKWKRRDLVYKFDSTVLHPFKQQTHSSYMVVIVFSIKFDLKLICMRQERNVVLQWLVSLSNIALLTDSRNRASLTWHNL